MRVVCLSFHVPPTVRPQSILIGKMLPEWVRQGIQPVVFALDSGKQWKNAPCDVVYLPTFKISKILRKFFFFRRYFTNKYYNSLTQMIIEKTKDFSPDIIFSFANPQSSNMIGAMVSQELGIPFVSHFSDPWFDNPLKKYHGAESRAVLSNENFVMKSSRKIIFTNQNALDKITKKYDEEVRKKSAVVPHCFDQSLYKNIKKTHDKFVIRYLGAFYQHRTPQVIFELLTTILKKNPSLIDKISLELVISDYYTGLVSQKIKEEIKEKNLDKIITVKPPVSYQESLDLMTDSDCLIALDVDLADSPFLPSKIIDYAGSKIPIIGIASLASPMSQFLTEIGCPAFTHQEIKSAADFLIDLVVGSKNIVYRDEELSKYSASSTTQKLISIFKEAI